MSQDDPFSVFGDDDRTIVRPTPGGRRGPAKESIPSISTPTKMPKFEDDLPGPFLYGENLIVANALPLLSLVSRLSAAVSHPAIQDLQQQLVNKLREFEGHCLRQGVRQEQVKIASYALCTLLDETILNTPWGAQSFWGHQSLLVLFHKEAWGGDRFFQILTQLVQQPSQNLFLIELFYLCISLGFQGKYRIDQSGPNALEQLRSELYSHIQQGRGDFERELSPRWQGLRDLRNALIRYVPLWVIAAAAGVLLLMVYLGFAFAINGASDPLSKQLFALAQEDIKLDFPAVSAVKTPTGRAERFKKLLAQEIGRNMVEVIDDRTLRIYNSFQSGSDRIKPEFAPMLDKIARELETGQDQVLVTGHTDDRPIFSAKFPSNWHLSAARAKNVAGILLALPGLAGKIRSEGRADNEALFPNDSTEHRALNRRVDLLIK